MSHRVHGQDGGAQDPRGRKGAEDRNYGGKSQRRHNQIRNSKVSSLSDYKANKKKAFNGITPELEGFRRPNGAQIEADLCVSDMGGLVIGFDYSVVHKRRSRGLY